MTDFQGFEILEQAAFQMIGADDEEKFIEHYRDMLKGLLMARLEDERAASVLAARLVDIIVHRRREIALSSSNTSEVLQ
jgi:hypothetical protein